MSESRDPKEEVELLQQELMHCFQHTCPSKQFLAELVLGTVWLGVLVLQLSRTRDLNERRSLKEEFWNGVATVRMGIGALWQEARIDPKEVKAEAERQRLAQMEPAPSTAMVG